MPKSKKPTPTQRQTPYPTPATPANPNPRFNSATPTNTRSTPTATSNPGARFLLPPRGFALGFPNPAYPQTTLTPFEAGQSLHDFCLDLQNGTQRPGDVGEDVHLGSGGVRGIEGDGKSAYDAPANGEGSGTGRKRRVEKVVRDSGVDHAEEISKKTSALSKRREDKDSFDPPLSKRQNRPPTGPSEEQIVRDGAVDHGEMISKTLKLSKRREDKGTLYPPSTQGQDQPPIGFSENPPTILDPCPPEQYLNSPKDSTPSDSDLAPPNSLTEQISLADILKPVANFNARTPWPGATSLRLLLDILREGSIQRTFQQLITQISYEMSLDIVVSTWMSGTDVSWASVEDARYVVQAPEH
ncbi:hypothetical protein E4T51_15131 [Aureobasidium sp. EXF-12344]|nr:hypothetical protein E4T51_15131 [Aureobasidium sp. EXF-12344]